MFQTSTGFAALTFLLVSGAGHAQEYPTKPIRVVTSAASGGSDFAARLIAQAIAGPLGQPVIVDNRSAGVIPGDIVSKAAKDGYTLLAYSNGLWTLPLLQKVPYDPLKDFAPVTLAVTAPNTLVVHPSVPANSVKELIALAKSKPGQLNYGSGGTGGSIHLGSELFKEMANVDIVRIAYKGGGAALIGLLGGEVQIMFAVAASATPAVKAGKLRALAVTSARRSNLAPGLPTMAESGVPGYELTAVTGIFAPAGTPAAILARLNKEIVQAVNRPDIREKFFASGVEAYGTSQKEAVAEMKAEVERLGSVIKRAGIGVQ